MPHFSKHALDSDPEGLARLREIQHGRAGAARTGKARIGKARTGKAVHATPTLAERFGTRGTAQDKPMPPSRFAFATTGSR